MPKEEWGTKRVCPTTGKRFYDLNRTPPVSPYTGDVVPIETGKRSMIAADTADKASAAKAKKDDSGDNDLIDNDDVEVTLDDDTVLEDEDDDNVSLDEITDVSDDNDDT